MIFFLVCGIAQRKDHSVILDAEITVRIEYKINDLFYLVLYLIGRNEKVSVVLTEMTASFYSFKRAGGLVSEIVSYFADTDGEISV